MYNQLIYIKIFIMNKKIKKCQNKLILSLKEKKKKVYALKELVSKITQETRYSEIDFGAPVGKEIL